MPCVIGSVLRLVVLVSAYCDLVRKQILSATSVSVWQEIKLSGSVPEILIACCLGAKQQRGKETGSCIQVSTFKVGHFQIVVAASTVQWKRHPPHML